MRLRSFTNSIVTFWYIIKKKLFPYTNILLVFKDTGLYDFLLYIFNRCIKWKYLSCHINKQQMSQPSVISGPYMLMRAPQTVVQQMLTPPWWLQKSWLIQEAPICQSLRWTTKQDLALDSWGAQMKGINSVSPEACISPYIEC